jgi:hypothetical protein
MRMQFVSCIYDEFRAATNREVVVGRCKPSVRRQTYVRWINVDHPFVNTGRRPLLNFDYLYSRPMR